MGSSSVILPPIIESKNDIEKTEDLDDFLLGDQDEGKKEAEEEEDLGLAIN